MRHVMDKTLIFLAMIALITIGMIQVSPTTKLTEDPGKHSDPQDVFSPQADNIEYVETPKIVSEINYAPEPTSFNPSILQLAPYFLRIRMHALNRQGCINLQNL